MRTAASILAALIGLLSSNTGTLSGGIESDGRHAQIAPKPAQSAWQLSFTTYGWLPWISGDIAVKGRPFDVDVGAGQVVDALDWSSVPAWFSYAEARNGRVILFNDIVYSKLANSADFAKSGPAGILTLSGNVSADYEQAIIEFGGAYEIWSGGAASGATAVRLLAGGRYWHQNAIISADLSATIEGLEIEGSRRLAKSGNVDWVDPFVGIHLNHKLEAGHSLSVRGDIGGFGAGSDFSWQIIATYDFQLCATDRYTIDGYVGYRALSVDYSQGSGFNRYEFDAVLQGPVMGSTLRF